MNKVIFFDDNNGLYYFGNEDDNKKSWFTKKFDEILGDSCVYEYYTYLNNSIVRYIKEQNEHFSCNNIDDVALIPDYIAQYNFCEVNVEKYFIFIDKCWEHSDIINEFEMCIASLSSQAQNPNNKIASICIYSAQLPGEAFESADELRKVLSETGSNAKIYGCRLNRTDAVNARDLFTQAFKKIKNMA